MPASYHTSSPKNAILCLPRMVPSRCIALFLGLFFPLLGCKSTQTISAPGYGGNVMRWDRPERTLVLGQEARGDTKKPDGRTSSSCKGGGRVGQAQDHLYGFEVKETASYRFELAPKFEGVIQIQQKEKEKPWYFGIGCAAARSGGKAVVSLALNPGFYWVVVDGNMWDQMGEYTLRADVDTSERAMIRPEDPKKVAEMVAKAEPLKVGERAYGVYKDTLGGARTSCGLINGDAVRKLSLDHKARLRFRVAAHFPFAFEVRPAGKCTRSTEQYDAELTVDLEPGESIVVLDATKLSPRRGNQSNELGRVGGAYIIDIEEVSP